MSTQEKNVVNKSSEAFVRRFSPGTAIMAQENTRKNGTNLSALNAEFLRGSEDFGFIETAEKRIHTGKTADVILSGFDESFFHQKAFAASW
ncbi:MAG: hypothetical protein IKS18_06640 [Lachnospiraceae bacterium]|nr:hypothetical protein [Lachnospiraceae bacterium]